MVKYKKQNQHKSSPVQPVQPTPNSCATGNITFQLAACDSWFFRESRPHDAVGATELASLFPPPMRTLVGAIRSYLGEQIRIDWRTFANDIPGFDFQLALGGVDDLGQLKSNGPWIVHNNQRLYPAPLYLMHGNPTATPDLQRLQAGPPVRSDLGHVRLPQLPSGLKGYKTLEQRWLTAPGLAKCLNGEIPAIGDIRMPEQLFTHEARLGIARDNLQRKVLDGRLYQTRHLRIQENVHIEVDVLGLSQQVIERLQHPEASRILRLGGEGRMASLDLSTHCDALPYAKPKTVESLILHFITPADFNNRWYPDDFEEIIDQNGLTVWQGTVNGIGLRIEAAVIGKVHREGGWDMKNHQPRPVKSYIPAGSVWFCRLQQTYDWPTLTEKLHGRCIGYDTAFGRGQILLGHWFDSSN